MNISISLVKFILLLFYIEQNKFILFKVSQNIIITQLMNIKYYNKIIKNIRNKHK